MYQQNHVIIEQDTMGPLLWILADVFVFLVIYIDLYLLIYMVNGNLTNKKCKL